MKLIKVNDQIINIDLLQSVTIDTNGITIRLAGEKYRFSGEEAVVLKEWFNRYAFDLMQHDSMVREQKNEDRPPLESLHQRLPGSGLFRMPFAIQ